MVEKFTKKDAKKGRFNNRMEFRKKSIYSPFLTSMNGGLELSMKIERV